MSGHTPGPWKATPRFQDKVDIIHTDNSVGASTKCVCRVNVRQSWLEEQLANARLIAAAPDLLEVAKECLEEFDGDYGTGVPHYYAHHVEKLRAVIAKATQL